MWQPASQMNSSPGWQWTRTPIWFDIVPEGTNSAASLPSISASRSCSAVDRRVFAEDVVADFGLGHGRPHGRRGPGHRVAAEVDELFGHQAVPQWATDFSKLGVGLDSSRRQLR